MRASLLRGGPLSDAFTPKAHGPPAATPAAASLRVARRSSRARAHGACAAGGKRGTVSVFVCIEYLFELCHCALLCLDAVLQAREVLLVALPVGMQFV